MSTDPSASARRGTPDPRMPVRAGQILRVPVLWAIPLGLISVLVAIITSLYIGSVVDPLGHLRGLPVAIVNQDRGATVGSLRLNAGRQVQSGLLASPQVSQKLGLMVSTLPQAERTMDRGGAYAMLVIPPDFTRSLLSVAGLERASGAATGLPRAYILTNQRAGTEGASLAAGILQRALAVASARIGRDLAAHVPASALTGATRAVLASPIMVTTSQYHQLGPDTALGLSAFYLALLTLMCGFFGATIVNSVVDSALGYSTSEIGPRWRQRQPVPINRWQTLLIKWAIVTALTAVLTAVMLLVAWALGMTEPFPILLWLYTWLCAASVAIGTIALFAAAGTYGQLIGLLIFVYAGLASAGGTVPVQALPTFLRALSYFEPLRQVLAGTRSILYFGAQADAGLARGSIAAALGLLFWLVFGSVIVRWYDRKRLYRLEPDLLAYVGKSVQGYKAREAAQPTEGTSGGPPGTDGLRRDRRPQAPPD